MTTKPRRKATPKVPAKPTPIEATQVLAYRGRFVWWVGHRDAPVRWLRAERCPSVRASG